MTRKSNIFILAYTLEKIRTSDKRKIFREIKESISGTQHDFTSGSMGKAVLLLSIPMVLEMIWESLFAVVDIYFVSQLGAEAVATVGITESLITIVYAIAVGLSMATTALVSRRIGEKNHKGASEAAFQAIIVGLTVSVFIGIIGILFAKDLLILMGASDIIVNEHYSYTQIMLGGNVVIMMLFIINAIFRSSGDAAISFRVLMVANVLNIILDPLLIFGIGFFPELGIKGAAIATNTGRGIAVLYQFYLLFRGNYRIKLFWSTMRIRFDLMINLLKISLGGIGQNIIATSSWIFLMVIIAEFGSEAIAGYTIAIRIIIFSLLPSWGISNAAATLVGQNLGARKPDRSEKAVWMTGSVNMGLLVGIGILFALFPSTFIRIFTQEANILQYGAQCLRVLSYGFIFYGFGMVLIQAFNGAGDTKTPTLINLLSFWMVEIPLAYLLAIHFGVAESGVYYAIVVAESILTVTAFILFRRGKWKAYQV